MNAISSFRSWVCDRPFGQSFIGRIVTGASFEFVGSQVGSLLGGRVLGSVLGGVGRVFAPVAIASGALYALRRKTTRAAAAVLGISIATSLLPKSLVTCYGWGPGVGLSLGYWVGKHVGSILGGYAGLKFVKSSTPFWDRTVLCDAYSVGMSKFIVAGEFFNSCVVRSTLPYVHFPINLIRGGAKIAFQTMAYYSNSILACLREHRFSKAAIFPIFIKTICTRYCEENATPITSRLIESTSGIFSVIPTVEDQFQCLLNKLARGPIKDGIRNMGERTDQHVIALMRAFPQYIALKEKKFRKIPFFSTQIEQISGAVLQAIQRAELNLTGSSFTQVEQETLSLHIENLLVYTLWNYDPTPLSCDEEKAFFLTLSKLYFSLHNHHHLALITEKGVRASLHLFFGFKKWGYQLIERPEQSAVKDRQVEIVEEYYPKVLPGPPRAPRVQRNRLSTI